MLNLTITISNLKSYKAKLKYDLGWKFLIYSILSISFLLVFRSQFPEIKFLQLLPGFYLFLLLISGSFLIIISDSLLNYLYKQELNTSSISKILKNFNFTLDFKFFFSCFFFSLLLSSTSIVPLSLESLINSSSENLESLWSFIQLIIIEFFFILVVAIFLEIPLFLKIIFTTENQIFLLIQNYKIISVFIVLIVGVLTPTVDIFTQITIGFITIFIYILLIILLKKTTTIKLANFCGITF